MKKLPLLLAALLLSSAIISSCSGDDDTNSSEAEATSSGIVSEAVSESVSEEASKEESKEESQETSEETSEESSEEVSVEPREWEYRSLISKGCSYTTNPAAADNYPDSFNAEMTDGALCEREGIGYNDPVLAGFAVSAGKIGKFTLDLGEVKDKLYAFEIDYLDTNQAGIAAPRQFSIDISEDGTNWTSFETVKCASESNSTCKTAVFETTDWVSARYVRFNITAGNQWLFLDELSVYADVEPEEEVSPMKEEIEKAYESETLTAKERAEKLASISTGKPDRTLKRVNIVKGKYYSSSSNALAEFPDTNNNMLSDGKTGCSMDDATWVGYNANTEIRFMMPVGSLRNDIAAVSIHAGRLDARNIQLPAYVTFYAGTNNSDWVEIGRVYAPTENVPQMFEYTLELDSTVSAKYIRAVIPASENASIYVFDEFGVYAYGSSTESIYPAVSFPEITKDELWSSSEPDYKTRKNLILGLQSQIASFEETYDSQNNTAWTSLIATDGKHSTSNNIHDGTFFKFYRAAGRSMYYDIGKLSSVDEINAEFLRRSAAGVDAPEKVTVTLSANGKDWYIAGTMNLDNSKDGIISGKLDLEKAVKARFVCFTFTVDVWCGVSELEVFGTKYIDANTVSLDKSGLKLSSNSSGKDSWVAPSEDKLGGVHDIFLAYHSKTADLTENQLKSVIAYLDKSGKMVDTLYDGVLFLMSGGFPSGGGDSTGGSNSYNMSDVEWLIKNIFSDTKNAGALETAAGKMKTELKLSDDYKVKYFVSLYSPKSSSFGDVDGDGKSENSETLEGKKKIIGWVINRFYEEFAKHNYKNIEFCGFYWYNEGMSNDAMKVVQFVSETVHSKGSQLFWIPYFKSEGYDKWDDAGIDVACLQPNYAFHPEVSIDRLDEAAAIARNNDMCLEIEMDHRAGVNDLYTQKFIDYLTKGAELGYMKNVIHMYYIGIGNFSGNAFSSDTEKRFLYDCLYQFIKGTLNIKPETLEDISMTTEKDTAVKYILESDSTVERSYIVYTSPSHGTVTVNPNGILTYYPDKGYTGEDSFEYAYSERLGYSDGCKVNVTIK